MLEEKWKNMYCFEVFRAMITDTKIDPKLSPTDDDEEYQSEWTIYLKSRSNSHPGEPDMKVWVCKDGREVAQFTDLFRGYENYVGHEEYLPGPVRKEAKKAWKDLCKGKFTEERLKELRENFIALQTARERHAIAALAQG